MDFAKLLREVLDKDFRRDPKTGVWIHKSGRIATYEETKELDTHSLVDRG